MKFKGNEFKPSKRVWLQWTLLTIKRKCKSCRQDSQEPLESEGQRLGFFFGSFLQVFLYLIGVNFDSKGFNETEC